MMANSKQIRRDAGFISLCLVFFIIMLDTTLIPFLYPILIADLKINVSQAAAINNLYLIAYAGTLLIGGKLGDLKNRKAVFLLGVAALGIGSLLGILSNNYTIVVLARFIMGLGAGLATPQSMAFISSLFEPTQRGIAFGIWGAVASIGTGLGPVVAKLASVFGHWELGFWINIPIAILSLILGTAFLENTAPGKRPPLRVMTLPAIAGMALMFFVYGMQVLGPDNGSKQLGSVMIIIALILGALAVKLRIRGTIPPLLNYQNINRTSYGAAVGASALLGGCLTAYYLPLSLSFSYVWGFGELTIVCLMVFAAIVNAFAGVLAGAWTERLGTRLLIIVGLSTFAGSCFLFGGLSLIDISSKLVLTILVAIVLAMSEVGTGIAFGPLANCSMASVNSQSVGEAAAFYNWVRQGFSAIGGVVIAFVTSTIIAEQEYSNSHVVGLASFVAFAVIGVFLIISAFISKGVKNA